MRVRLEGHTLPGRTWGPGPDFPEGHHNVHVAVQRKGKPGELLDLFPGDADEALWVLECSAVSGSDGIDVKGAYVQGPSGGRFIYLSWGVVSEAGEFTMFRRAKLWLDGVPTDVLAAAASDGVLVGRLSLTDALGGPICASVRPPLIDWMVRRR